MEDKGTPLLSILLSNTIRLINGKRRLVMEYKKILRARRRRRKICKDTVGTKATALRDATCVSPPNPSRQTLHSVILLASQTYWYAVDWTVLFYVFPNSYWHLLNVYTLGFSYQTLFGMLSAFLITPSLLFIPSFQRFVQSLFGLLFSRLISIALLACALQVNESLRSVFFAFCSGFVIQRLFTIPKTTESVRWPHMHFMNYMSGLVLLVCIRSLCWSLHPLDLLQSAMTPIVFLSIALVTALLIFEMSPPCEKLSTTEVLGLPGCWSLKPEITLAMGVFGSLGMSSVIFLASYMLSSEAHIPRFTGFDPALWGMAIPVCLLGGCLIQLLMGVYGHVVHPVVDLISRLTMQSIFLLGMVLFMTVRHQQKTVPLSFPSDTIGYRIDSFRLPAAYGGGCLVAASFPVVADTVAGVFRHYCVSTDSDARRWGMSVLLGVWMILQYLIHFSWFYPYMHLKLWSNELLVLLLITAPIIFASVFGVTVRYLMQQWPTLVQLVQGLKEEGSNVISDSEEKLSTPSEESFIHVNTMKKTLTSTTTAASWSLEETFSSPNEEDFKNGNTTIGTPTKEDLKKNGSTTIFTLTKKDFKHRNTSISTLTEEEFKNVNTTISTPTKEDFKDGHMRKTSTSSTAAASSWSLEETFCTPRRRSFINGNTRTRTLTSTTAIPTAATSWSLPHHRDSHLVSSLFLLGSIFVLLLLPSLRQRVYLHTQRGSRLINERLTVITHNIQMGLNLYGKGNSGFPSTDRFYEFNALLSPHIWGIQESSSANLLQLNRDYLSYLAGHGRFFCHPGAPSYVSTPGVALLSAQKLDNASVTVLPRGDEPVVRLLLAANYRWRRSPGADPIMDVHVVNTHLSSFSKSARRLQLAALKQLLPKQGPLVLLGDFNEQPESIRWFMEGTTIKFVPVSAPTETATFFNVDHIYYRDLCLMDYGVANTVGSSDHLPVWASFDPPDVEGNCPVAPKGERS